jgi:rhamnosyltransferase
MPERASIAIVVPTLNAAAGWQTFAQALLACADPSQVLVIDSSSSDRTVQLARKAGFRVFSISRKDFNHGGTRQLALTLVPDATIFVYLTQDAVLAERSAIDKLLEAFSDPAIGAAYGRQLPRPGARPLEAHARLFNYPDHSNIRTLASRERLGLKTIFISNSFAAYRRTALMEARGFPDDVIFGEDTVVAAKLLLKGWSVAYVADACVYHSHSYTFSEEFRRYFDIGVLHARQSQLFAEFGHASGEGLRFVRSELCDLWPRFWFLIPSALLRTAMKLIAYRLGLRERQLSLTWKRRLSLNRSFWRAGTF